MYGIKRESGEVLCHGCLSADRKLSPLTDYELFFTMLGNKQSVEEYKYLNIPLCWECHALLRRTLVFRHRLQQAEYMLSLVNTQQISTDSLSSLVYNYKQDIDCFIEECIETKPDIELTIDNSTGIEVKLEFEEDKYEIDNIESNYSDTCQTENEPKEIEPPPKKKKKYKKDRENTKMQIIETSLDLNNLDNYFSKVCLSEKEVEEILAKEREEDVGRPCKCKFCGFRFGTKTEVHNHGKNMHRQCPSVGKCPHCPFSYRTPWDLELHCWRTHEASRCVLCGALVARAHCLRRHLRLHSRRYRCRECNMEFDNKQLFLYHENKMHSKCVCDHCGHVSAHKKTLEKHVIRHHLPNKCPDCGLVCPTWKILRRHKTCHRGHSTAPDAYCVECDIKFATPMTYRRHLSESARHRPKENSRFPCPECDQTFARRYGMKNHMKLVHSKQSKHHCQLCDKYFVNGYGLRVHLKFVHEKVKAPKNKVCSVCGRGFKTNRILTNHMRTHTGERPFACTHCSAAFAQHVALKSHLASIHKEK